MLHTDPRFSEAVEQAVGEIEQHTDAEVVVVATERSGQYRDVAMVGGFVVAMAMLVVVVFAPWSFHPVMSVVEVVLAFALGTWVLNGRWFLRHLVRRRRKVAQVRRSAQAEFVSEAVHSTPNRTGVLVYASALERQVVMVHDVGIQGRVPAGEWAPVKRALSPTDVDGFVRGLRMAGEILAIHVPKLEVDEIDLPNAPRVRS